MGSFNFLEDILFKIENKILEKSVFGQDELLNSFKILGGLFLIQLLENYNIIEPASFFKQKVLNASEVFPTIIEINLLQQYSEIYQKMNTLSKKHNNETSVDPLGELYQGILTKTAKQGKGMIFTPVPVINYILHQVGFPNQLSIIDNQTIIDLSSGSGLFLAKAVDLLLNQNLEITSTSEILSYIQDNVIGFDIDLIAVFISKFNLALTILNCFKGKFSPKLSFIPNIHLTNSLDKQGKKDPSQVKATKNKLYDFVVGNPPYIEAKRMDKKTKKLCLDNFPKAARAHFDVYSCFVELGIDLLKAGGKLGYIIPSKFLSSRYSKEMRRYLLENNLISEVVDLTHQNVFQPAVYPIILILDKNKQQQTSIKLAHNVNYDELLSRNFNSKIKNIETEFFNRTTNKTIFLPDSTSLSIIDSILNKAEFRLGDLIKFRWAISFHKRGLREHFVFEKPTSDKSRKFLGGKPFGGNREVERYSINWRGYYLEYDHEKAIGMKNNFPDIGIFGSKKIIICQHALRMRATIDEEGYVCKDIFLLGHLTQEAKNLGISLEFILSLLNSELFSYLYSIMYSSTEITGKYLHYLPMYLHDLPLILPDNNLKEQLEQKVTALLKQKHLNQSIDTEVDNHVYDLFQLEEKERKYVKRHISQYLVK